MRKPSFIFVQLLVTSLTLSTAAAWAQKNQPFPSVAGTTLSGKSMSLPNQVKGKPTLVAVAYSKKSDELLQQWYEPIYTTFIDPPQMALFADDPYDVNMYFVALLKGISKLATDKITRQMENGINRKYHDNVLLYQGNISQYKQALNLGQKDLPYFFVLDETGRIVHHTSGAYSDRKLYEIKAAIDQW